MIRRAANIYTKGWNLSTSQHANISSRTPLIKFVGKRSKDANALSEASNKTIASAAVVIPPPAAPVAVNTSMKKVLKVGTGVDFLSLKGTAWYGRPRMSTAEMEAVDSGGATL